MILDNVKSLIKDNIGVKHKFLYKGSRNQNDIFFGSVYKVFPAIFLIKMDNGETRCFSYNDFLISNISFLD
jgi:uncharacterized protein Veg